MRRIPSALYLGGFRVPCVRIIPDGLRAESGAASSASRERGAESPAGGQCAVEPAGDSLPEGFPAPLLMARFPGPAPDGWISVPRGYARPRPANPEPLTPLCFEHFPAMRGLYGLSAGRFNGMLAREDPSEWDARLSSLHNPLGLIENGRLLLWLDERDGDLLELSAAPDALDLIPGALTAAGVTRAPASLLGVSAEETDETLKLRLVRPFHLSDERIETAQQLTRAMDGTVQWD